jgi:hypothetical protein
MTNVRIRLSAAGAVVALAVSVAVFAPTSGAVATQGQAIIAGVKHQSESEATTLYNSNAAFDLCVPGGASGEGFAACGNIGVEGRGVSGANSVLGTGVSGEGDVYGVRGFSNGDGGNTIGVEGVAVNTGVYGSTIGNTTGIGVWGHTKGVGSGVYGEATPNGVGVVGHGGPTGVSGNGTTYGVEGSSGTGGTGVYGHNSANSGIGVWGQMGGVGTGVYGQSTAFGVGVLGDAPVGTGVQAKSTDGTALDVVGKATFSRSGVVTVVAGTSSKTVTLAGVTTSSMVLATAQQAKAVHVKAAVPGTGSFTIRLTGKAPVGGLKVAYFVLN